MKSFKNYLTEELNKYQKSWVDKILSTQHPSDIAANTSFSDHIFGGPSSGFGRSDDKNTLIMPFQHVGTHTEPSDHFKDFLGKIKYRIHDWSKGLAIREGSNRPISISKILNSNSDLMKMRQSGNITDEDHQKILAELQKHRQTQAIGTENLEVMISRNPYHIANQSTNTGWRSCLTLGTCPGEEDSKNPEIKDTIKKAYDDAKKLKKPEPKPGLYWEKNYGDILGGSHVAFLIKKGDYDLSDPLARISLKPYQEIPTTRRSSPVDQPKRINIQQFNLERKKQLHTILRPIGNTYKKREFSATDPLITSFENQIQRFTDENFIQKKDTRYSLRPSVQRDRNAQEIIN